MKDNLRTFRFFHPVHGEYILVGPCDTWDYFDWEFFLQKWNGQIQLSLQFQKNQGQSGLHVIDNGLSWAQHWEKNFLDILIPEMPIIVSNKIYEENGHELISFLIRPEIFSTVKKVVMPIMPDNPLLAKGALFLDRDGIINLDHGYVSDPNELIFVDGIFDILRWAKSESIDVFVLTNQSGIAKGLYTTQEMQKIHDIIADKVKNEGGEIKDFFYCPYHHDTDNVEFNYFSMLRKPGPGMLYQAAQKYTFSMARSVMIGDKPTDALIGGVRTLLLKGNYEIDSSTLDAKIPVFNSLKKILDYLRKYKQRFSPKNTSEDEYE